VLKPDPSAGPSAGPSDQDAPSGWFHTTHWSVVLAAGRDSTATAEAALERLCETYWLPAYVFVRSLGYSTQDAEDHTQNFFMHLLSTHLHSQADPNRGRFRNFLLTSLRHFLADARSREEAAKRGGGSMRLRLDPDRLASFEAAWQQSPPSPERAYDEHWALSLAETVLARLRTEFSQIGRTEFFDELKGYVWGQQATTPYAELATRFGLTQSGARVTVHRLRRRFAELLRSEVANTVATPEEVEAEIKYLAQLLCG